MGAIGTDTRSWIIKNLQDQPVCDAVGLTQNASELKALLADEKIVLESIRVEAAACDRLEVFHVSGELDQSFELTIITDFGSKSAEKLIKKISIKPFIKAKRISKQMPLLYRDPDHPEINHLKEKVSKPPRPNWRRASGHFGSNQ